jgi:anti-repressor protein
MNELRIFNYKEASVRTVQIDGEPWFVLKDVCDVLGLTDTNKISTRLDQEELTRIKFVSGGQSREMLCVNESGLYNVILRSDKPEAKPFRKWVTSEVLPSIRKHGAYMTPETLQAAILNPDYLLQVVTAKGREAFRMMIIGTA